LLTAFNEVTSRLEATHDQLRAEVSRLNAELARANEEVERSRRLAALGEMAAGIAHEIRNPLGSIRLYARMLDEDLRSRPEQHRIACRIAEAARTIDAIVRDVLAFARGQAVRAEPVSASEVLTEALSACMEGSSGVRVVRKDLERGVVRMLADVTLMRQALANVIRNAIEAMEGVERERVLTLDAFHRTGQVTLSVRDTGVGVTEDVARRMFNPFFTTRAAGTGLGLAIVHRIVEGHGGRVSVHNNTPEPGATVELVLPAAPAAREDHRNGAVRVRVRAERPAESMA
jgi:signal transduction histidine kinase